MSVFGGDYSACYDLFYADKDYATEAAFVRTVIDRHSKGARSLLDIGCGSARHAIEFARAGLSVTGIDRSAAMVAQGMERLAQLPADLRMRVRLQRGDAVGFVMPDKFDVATSLFHAVCYQTTDQALNGIFRSARLALKPGALFVFDFWYGPAVLAQEPEVRERRVSTADAEITRKAEPAHHPDRHVVDVKYTLTVRERKTGRTGQDVEVHSVRYLFLPEIEALAARNRFALVESGEWLTGKALDATCWSGYAALRATD